MFFLTGILIFFSFIFYKLFIQHPEIRWQFKILDFFYKLIGRFYLKLLTKNFNRERFNKIKNLEPRKNPTKNSFQNGILIEDVEIESKWKEDPYSNKKIKIQIFVPEIAKEKTSPILINIHGGGFVLEYNDDKSYKFSKEGIIVVSIQYRLAPEHIYPTALEDCYSVFKWLEDKENETINKFGDFNKIGIVGDSAGGNLTALIPFLLRERNSLLKISFQILIYPAMLMKEMTDSKRRLQGKDYILSLNMMKWFHESYLGENHEELSERCFVNPLKQSSFLGIPPALILLATQDILYSEGKMYSEKLIENQIESEIIEYESIHGFFKIEGLPEEKKAHKDIVEYLKKHKFL